jgi:beta-lactamase superfamily II metal-dependent hydrolase
VVAVFLLFAGAAAYLGWKYAYPWWKKQAPAPSGGELKVHVLDVGPINGDSILIISPAGKTALIDAGDTSKGKTVLEALKKHGVQQLDFFIATHPHPDHMGGAADVIKNMKVVNILDNGLGPSVPENLKPPAKPATVAKAKPTPQPRGKSQSITRFYDDYKDALNRSGANYSRAQPGNKLDLGGGAVLTVLAPTEPLFTKEHMKAGGNEPNANSVVLRLDYGSFSMLLVGDAEAQTEHRLVSKDLNLAARVIKIGHHGSKYATSESFLNRVQPAVAVISCGEWNRYGHPSQTVLDRLQAAKVKLYRTDVQGEITITTRGRENDHSIKVTKTSSDSDLWLGRIAQKDDSTRSGFIAYGDFGPPPKPRPAK